MTGGRSSPPPYAVPLPSGIHEGAWCGGEKESFSDRDNDFILQCDDEDGPYYHQTWEGIEQTTPIIFDGTIAMRLPEAEVYDSRASYEHFATVTKISRIIGASSIHMGAICCGEKEGLASDKDNAVMLLCDDADEPRYHQTWDGMEQTMPVIPYGRNATRLLEAEIYNYRAGYEYFATATKVSHTTGASSISGKDAVVLRCDDADEPYYHQTWEGMEQTMLIISDGMNANGMNATRLPEAAVDYRASYEHFATVKMHACEHHESRES